MPPGHLSATFAVVTQPVTTASSLAAFSSGALIPLLPYLAGLHSLAAALAITGVALLAGGMTVGSLIGAQVH